MGNQTQTLTLVLVFFLAVSITTAAIGIKNLKNKPDRQVTLKEEFSRPVFRLPILQATAKDAVVYRSGDRNELISVPYFSASSVLAWDYQNDRVFFYKESETPRPIASITKLMTAAVVIDNTLPNDEVRVSSLAISSDGSAGGLALGEAINVKTLLAALLIESSNDAAVALAEYTGSKITGTNGKQAVNAFVNLMNNKASSLALTNTHFLDPAGLNDDGLSTAYDIAKLVKYLRTNSNYTMIWEILAKSNFVGSSVDGQVQHVFSNTNPFASILPASIGGKTGYTEQAGESLALVVKSPNESSEIIYIILGSKNRIDETKNLINWVNNAYIW